MNRSSHVIIYSWTYTWDCLFIKLQWAHSFPWFESQFVRVFLFLISFYCAHERPAGHSSSSSVWKTCGIVFRVVRRLFPGLLQLVRDWKPLGRWDFKYRSGPHIPLCTASFSYSRRTRRAVTPNWIYSLYVRTPKLWSVISDVNN